MRLIEMIEELPQPEINDFATKFEAFEVAQRQILEKQAPLRALPSRPFKVPAKARWQPLPKKQHGKANQRGLTGAEVLERAANKAIAEL